MNTTEILGCVERLGVRLDVQDDKIVCHRASNLTPELRDAIKENRDQLLMDVLVREALRYLDERYVEGADLSALSGPIHDEVCEAYGAGNLEAFRVAVSEYVREGLVAFETARIRSMA